MFFVIQSLSDTIYDTFVSEAFWNHSDIDFILCTAKKIAFQIETNPLSVSVFKTCGS